MRAHKKIRNIADFAAALGLMQTDRTRTDRALLELISHWVYKYTDCGAWVDARDVGGQPGIGIGSIVEGVDQTTDTQTLAFPFTEKQLWDALQHVEEQAEEIWMDTHGCEACGEEDPETGYRHVNPDCKTCGGHGGVI